MDVQPFQSETTNSNAKRVLYRDEERANKYASESSAVASRRCEKSYIKCFLDFLNVSDRSEIIVSDRTNNNCSNYISAIWEAGPFVGPATLRHDKPYFPFSFSKTWLKNNEGTKGKVRLNFSYN